MRSTMDTRVAFAALLLTFLSGSALCAQSAAAREVMLVALEKPAQRAAMVYRRSADAAPDIIALAPSATVDDLNRALRVLDAIQEPDATRPRNLAVAVRSEHRSGPPDTARDKDHPNHGEFLKALRQAPRSEVRGFGRVRSLTIRIASHR